MYIVIICHWAILHCNLSFKAIAGRSDGVFWWFPALSEDQEKICQIHQNYLVALTGNKENFNSDDGKLRQKVRFMPIVSSHHLFSLFSQWNSALVLYTRVCGEIIYFYHENVIYQSTLFSSVLQEIAIFTYLLNWQHKTTTKVFYS